jgi:hypothetical protein
LRKPRVESGPIANLSRCQSSNGGIGKLLIWRKNTHPFTLAYAYGTTALALLLVRDCERVRAQAIAGATISRDQGFPQFRGFAEAMWGWVLTNEGQIAESIDCGQGLSVLQGFGCNPPRFKPGQLWRPCLRRRKI